MARRVVLPVRDATNDLVGFTRYQPNAALRNERQPKMKADAGSTRELFPPPETIADDELSGVLWLVEGEPDAVRLWSLGLPAVAVPRAQNWRDEWAPRFSGRRLTVLVCFDADEAGRQNAVRAAAALVAAGVDVRVVSVDGHADHDGYDLSDLLNGKTADEARALLAALLRDAQPFTPPDALEEVALAVRRYVVVGEHELVTLALWVAHTHAFDAAEATPYMAVS